MMAGSDREAMMRARILIAVLAALAMFAVAHTATPEDRVIGAPVCAVDCAGHETEADNGIGTSLPVDPNNYDDGDDSFTCFKAQFGQSSTFRAGGREISLTSKINRTPN
jgi:hypothetical protein